MQDDDRDEHAEQRRIPRENPYQDSKGLRNTREIRHG
jgi:hypothetical protein